MSANDVSYPFSIKNVVSKMTESTQKALQQRCTRMEIELPPACDFGIEISKASLSNSDKIRKSNREVARMYNDMLSSFSTNIVALFPSEEEAAIARKIWNVLFRGQVLSIDAPDASSGGYGKLRSRRFSALEQEQALMATDGIYVPDGTEVVLIVGPRQKDLKKIRKLHERLGEDALIVLINARLSLIDQLVSGTGTSSTTSTEATTIRGLFTSVFHYAPPAIDKTNRELLLYYEFGKQWALAEKDTSPGLLGFKLGSQAFKTLWQGADAPTTEEIQAAIMVKT
jgi:hypothetical protein